MLGMIIEFENSKPGGNSNPTGNSKFGGNWYPCGNLNPDGKVFFARYGAIEKCLSRIVGTVTLYIFIE